MSEREPDYRVRLLRGARDPGGSVAATARCGARSAAAVAGPRPPRGPVRPRAGFTPLLRLLGLIAFAILIVVLLLLWAQSCQEDQKRDAYSDYMTRHVGRRGATPSASAAS